MGITLEEIEVNASLPINPTIIRIMRVLRIARGRSGFQRCARLPTVAGLQGEMERVGYGDGYRFPRAFPPAPAIGVCPARAGWGIGGPFHQLQPSLALPAKGWETRRAPVLDTVLFLSAEAAEDGCGHAGAAGHGDAGPAPGSWEVGWAEGKGPPGEEEVPSERAGGSGKLTGEPAASFPFLFLFSRWGTWDFSSCYCFSSLQLWAWSSLETWVS